MRRKGISIWGNCISKDTQKGLCGEHVGVYLCVCCTHVHGVCICVCVCVKSKLGFHRSWNRKENYWIIRGKHISFCFGFLLKYKGVDLQCGAWWVITRWIDLCLQRPGTEVKCSRNSRCCSSSPGESIVSLGEMPAWIQAWISSACFVHCINGALQEASFCAGCCTLCDFSEFMLLHMGVISSHLSSPLSSMMTSLCP